MPWTRLMKAGISGLKVKLQQEFSFKRYIFSLSLFGTYPCSVNHSTSVLWWAHKLKGTFKNWEEKLWTSLTCYVHRWQICTQINKWSNFPFIWKINLFIFVFLSLSAWPQHLTLRNHFFLMLRVWRKSCFVFQVWNWEWRGMHTSWLQRKERSCTKWWWARKWTLSKTGGEN